MNARQVAFYTLKVIFKQQTYADVALDRTLQKFPNLAKGDRALVTELVYGITRRQRTLDVLICQFTGNPIQRQSPDLRLILQIGIYQICYLDHIPDAAAVSTTVDLAKSEKMAGLAGLVNAVLRRTCREYQDFLSRISDLGMRHSFPDWLIQQWLEQFGTAETDRLCQWFNQPPHMDLRVNLLKITASELGDRLKSQGINTESIPLLPNSLRLAPKSGNIPQLDGFAEGLWTVQDASAQMAALVLDPQPHEVIIDACAAPGGKSTHIAELMGDQGTIYACDRTPSRLQKLQQNCDRLGLNSIKIRLGDSREFKDFQDQADRVLLDVPCSGLGTLHRHADARWRQTPENILPLTQLQTELIDQTAFWVKAGGTLVYSTCTINPVENEEIVRNFLATHSNWQIRVPKEEIYLQFRKNHQPWLQILPHHHNMDGFFIAQLQRNY